MSFTACLSLGIVFRGVSCVGYIKKLILFFIIMVTIFQDISVLSGWNWLIWLTEHLNALLLKWIAICVEVFEVQTIAVL